MQIIDDAKYTALVRDHNGCQTVRPFYYKSHKEICESHRIFRGTASHRPYLENFRVFIICRKFSRQTILRLASAHTRSSIAMASIRWLDKRSEKGADEKRFAAASWTEN